jgi:cytochrome c556
LDSLRRSLSLTQSRGAKKLMTLNGKGFFGDITRMVRGQAPYDQAKVNAAFHQIVLSAKTFPSLFPDNAKPGAKTSTPPEDKYKRVAQSLGEQTRF